MFNRTWFAPVIFYIVIHIFNTSIYPQDNRSAKKEKSKFGTVNGQVFDKNTKQPLVGTNIVIVGTNRGSSTDNNGAYIINQLFPAKYTIEFSYIGYQTERIEGLQIMVDSNARLDVELEPQPLQLNDIIITPGRFAVMGREPTVRQALTKQDLQTIPFGEDIYRAITRLPGVSSNDFSAKFTVRGGKNEEILVLMDGQQLYEPFHLKDLDGGALSIVDVETIEGIDLYTGGYPAEYGECLSGVFDIKSTGTRKRPSQTSLGISFMNARLMSRGQFQENKGSWLISARRGYLDLVLDLMEEETPPQPIYYDIFGKLLYKMNDNNSISVNILHSGDKLDFVDDDEDEANTRYGNSYGWLTWKSHLNSQLFIRNSFSFGRITHNREGIGYFDNQSDIHYKVSDDNWVNLFGLKQDWDFKLSDRWYLKWGFYLHYENTDYDYKSILNNWHWIDQHNYYFDTDSSSAKLELDGERFGGYLSNRFQIIKPLSVEVGLRYDSNVYTDDRHLSPRFSTVYALGKQTFLRSGWGYFYQSQRMHEIKVAYGETDFFPAQRAKHWVAGLEHTFRNGLNIRMEAYKKNISDPRPDHGIFSNTIELFPEVEEDVFSLNLNSTQSKGLEFYLKYDQGGKFSCWTSYALSFADQDVKSIIYQGKTFTLKESAIPNRYDQRHAIYLDLNYRPNRNWHINASWQYHSGWPYTEKVIRSRQLPDGNTEYYSEYERFFENRLSAYQRMDLQINRHFHFSKSRLSLFLAVINLYNHNNLRNIKFSQRLDEQGRLYLAQRKEYWFPLLPTLGVTWTWTH